MQYNVWQSVYFALIRDHGWSDEEAVVGESQSNRQRRIREMYNGIQQSLHGPDHLAAALTRTRGVDVPGLGNHGIPEEVSLFRTSRESREADLPAVGGPSDWGTLESTTARQDPGRDAAQGLPSQSVEVFSMFTPRGRQRQLSLIHI